MTTAIVIEPCRAGFPHCAEMRAEDAARHPRTPRVRECRHMPIPPERPEKLRGPEIGSRWRYVKGNSRRDGQQCTVTERSYVWAPGDASYGGGSRRYDWSVVRFDDGATLVVDDVDLVAP